MSFYRRRLPHWQPRDKALFVTWRLHDSIGYRLLLKRAGLANLVESSLRFGAEKADWYTLYAYVVMPNHVHFLIDTNRDLATVMKSVKRYTAHRANAVLRRIGKPFWQPESFDHWLRTEREFRDTADYIVMNPVRAGLVQRPEDFRWSSAWKGRPLADAAGG